MQATTNSIMDSFFKSCNRKSFDAKAALAAFVASDDQQWAFPSWLTKAQRMDVHRSLSWHSNVTHFSVGIHPNRQLVLRKPTQSNCSSVAGSSSAAPAEHVPEVLNGVPRIAHVISHSADGPGGTDDSAVTGSGASNFGSLAGKKRARPDDDDGPPPLIPDGAAASGSPS